MGSVTSPPLVAYGSTMHLLVHQEMDGSVAANIKALWAEAKNVYTDLGIERVNRFTNMHATMFKVMCLLFIVVLQRVCLPCL